MNKQRYVSKRRMIPPRVPIDFGSEIVDAGFDLDPSLVQSQAGQYFVKNIGLFGEADPTEKVGSVIEQQTADSGQDTALTVSDEHPASANIQPPPSHQKEGRPKVLRRIMKGGMVDGDEDSVLPPPQGESPPTTPTAARTGGRTREARAAARLDAEAQEAEAQEAEARALAARAIAEEAYDRAVEIAEDRESKFADFERAGERADALKVDALRLEEEAEHLRAEADAAMVVFFFDRGL